MDFYLVASLLSTRLTCFERGSLQYEERYHHHFSLNSVKTLYVYHPAIERMKSLGRTSVWNSYTNHILGKQIIPFTLAILKQPLPGRVMEH